MKYLNAVAISFLIAILTSCVSYPRQLGLVSEPSTQYGTVIAELLQGSPKPIFRLSAPDGMLLDNHYCFAPTMIDVVQGPIGSLVWIRDSSSEFEVEAILRSTVSLEDLRLIRLYLNAKAANAYVLSPCPMEVTRISPLADSSLADEVSFGYGRDGGSVDIFLIRMRGSWQKKDVFLRGLQTPTGVLFAVNYRIGVHPDQFDAFLRLRSGALTK